MDTVYVLLYYHHISSSETEIYGIYKDKATVEKVFLNVIKEDFATHYQDYIDDGGSDEKLLEEQVFYDMSNEDYIEIKPYKVK